MKHSACAVLQNSFLMRKKDIDIHFNIRCFQAPKSSKKFFECEDAFFVDNLNDPKLIAIADGCGSTFAPKIMAESLTQDFPKYAKEIFKKDLKNWHRNTIKKWEEQTKKFGYDKIPSFLRGVMNKRYGASTFLGIQIQEKSFMTKVNVINVGDTALFHLDSKGKIKKMIPQLEKFTGATLAISSQEKGFPFYLQKLNFHYLDTIVLATDGIGDWIISHKEELDKLVKIQSDTEFLDFVYAIRKEQPSLDDDSTLIIIEAVKILHKQKGQVPSEQWMREYDELQNVHFVEKTNMDTPEIVEIEESIEDLFDKKAFKKRLIEVLELSEEEKDQELVLTMINKFSSEELNHFISILKPLFHGNESAKSDRQ